MTTRHVPEQLYFDEMASNYGTVQRLPMRLEQKGFVVRDRSQFVHLFWAIVTRPPYASEQLDSLVEKLTDVEKRSA